MNKNTTTQAIKDFADKEIVIAEMKTAMGDLRRQNQTLEDNILHIQQR